MPIAAAIKANYRPSADHAVGAQLLNIIRSNAAFLDRHLLISATEMNKIVR